MHTFEAHALLTRNGTLDYPCITVDQGKIVTLTSGTPNASTEIWAAPFFDIHVHGAVTYDFMAASQAEIDDVGRFLATRGTAFYLPTTVTTSLDTTLRALDRIACRIDSPPTPAAAAPVSIHLEGPFLCPAKRGVHPLHQILAPSIPMFDRFQQAARGHIRLMTLAPEMPGALDLIRHATAAGVRVSLGHSNANTEEAQAAISAGAVSATHTFNAMRALDHREPGLAAVVLDTPTLYAEAIVDGIHVHPAMIRFWLRMKGEHRAILVTDGMSATGMPEGHFKLGDLDVEVRNGVCLSGGVLAGSVLTQDQAVANLRQIAGTSLAVAVGLASHNPAEMMGLDSLMRFAPGCPANCNIFNKDGHRVGSLLNGVRIPAQRR